MKVNSETIALLAAQNKRLDQRALTDYRQPIKIETNISWTAEGSSKVQIGETIVICGVKLSLDKPYNDTPDEGGITVNAELTPLSSPNYEPGPPGIKAVELARVVDRGIREAKALDLKKLCVKPGEKAWFVIIDIITLNDAGNLFDTAGLAVLAALKSARLPVVDAVTGAIDYKKKTDVALPLVKEALPVTVYNVKGHLMIDPTVAEEEAYDSRLTVASDADGTISAMQKGGAGVLSVEDISRMIDLSIVKAKFLRQQLNSFFK
ncbi:exosome complex protein Rrp42 [Candidatus Woesearchaeota archaeon]|nr:exosome complex protein Rrp42 [Candidatus Woesearchaeota archaeon]